jgi:hypothetical protein
MPALNSAKKFRYSCPSASHRRQPSPLGHGKRKGLVIQYRTRIAPRHDLGRPFVLAGAQRVTRRESRGCGDERFVQSTRRPALPGCGVSVGHHGRVTILNIPASHECRSRSNPKEHSCFYDHAYLLYTVTFSILQHRAGQHRLMNGQDTEHVGLPHRTFFIDQGGGRAGADPTSGPCPPHQGA